MYGSKCDAKRNIMNDWRFDGRNLFKLILCSSTIERSVRVIRKKKKKKKLEKPKYIPKSVSYFGFSNDPPYFLYAWKPYTDNSTRYLGYLVQKKRKNEKLRNLRRTIVIKFKVIKIIETYNVAVYNGAVSSAKE